MNERLFVFWRYDQFPYCIGAEVEKFCSDGFVKPKGYGGMCFKPIIILPYEEGVIINNNLKKLEKEYYKKFNELKINYINKSYETASFLKSK